MDRQLYSGESGGLLTYAPGIMRNSFFPSINP